MSIKLAEVHVQQSTQVSCVAACVCMVRRRTWRALGARYLLHAYLRALAGEL